MPEMKTFKLVTLGCKVNQYESDVMRAACIEAGYVPVTKGGCADLVVVNTCTVTATAAAKSRRALRSAIRANPGAKVVAAGCAVEADAAMFEKVGDGILLLKQSRKSEFPGLLGIETNGRKPLPGRTRAFLKIQDGCDRFCTYCIVPHVRSELWSKPLDEVLREAEYLASLGHREIVLTGIRLGLYNGGGGADLAALVRKLSERPGPERLRLSSLEMWNISDELLSAASGSGKFCRHLHISLQSGDDGILRAMNRPYTSDEFLARIKDIREALSGVAITTDVIVGFPGEGEREFENTLRVCREARFVKMHIFPFSPRAGTRAVDLPGRPDRAAVDEHLGRLRDLEEELAREYRRGLVGKVVEVLVENRRDSKTGLPCGTSREYVKVLVEGDKVEPSTIVNARILSAEAGSITGIRIPPENQENICLSKKKYGKPSKAPAAS